MSDRETHQAEELRCKDTSVLWRLIREAGPCDGKEAGYQSEALSPRNEYLPCQSLPSSTAHLTIALLSFIYFFSPRSVIEQGHKSFIQIFFHLCVLCLPLIYCWTCLQNDPGAFHSVKEEKKDSQWNVQWVCTHILHRENCSMNHNELTICISHYL